ncbi:hypothetical protein [Streptomyces violarus]|uniref:hypothetical protein n=1 Tax=Streptomyces violarus TaxID=67380 RepID=UPI0021BEB9C5|nr:hypothetical protein [Streptomyces violarus]MCT9142430.1 hypothetical protein [Streptomyces violarus]
MTERLTSAEIVTELRDALGEDGWLPALAKGEGPGHLPRAAPLSELREALASYARTASLPAAVTLQLGRASEALAGVHEADEDSGLYGMLGTALAYLVQARGSAEIAKSPA